MKYTDDQIEALLQGIYDGTYNDRNLPKSLYFAIADYLKEAIYDGFGGSLDDFDGQFLDNLIDLRDNIYLFGGAKTFQYTKESSALLIGDNQVLRSFSEFKQLALPIYDQYNVNWLKTEYDTTIGQSQMANQWQYIQETKDTLPLLIYDAVEDSHTSDICRGFDGIILPVDDPFWIKYSPLNHFNCRCIRRQASEGEITQGGKVATATSNADKYMQPLFKSNPGITGEIFDKDHPYFDVDKKDKTFAKKNFNLPIPEKD